MKQPRKMKPARKIGTKARALPSWWEIKSAGRSGRMPLTLLSDARTGVLAYSDLTALARSQQAKRPCYARQAQRNARQLNEGLTAAGAVATWTETPATTATTLTEPTLSEVTFSEPTLADYTANESHLTIDP